MSSSRRGQNASADKDRRSEDEILKGKMSTGSEKKARRSSWGKNTVLDHKVEEECWECKAKWFGGYRCYK